MMIVVFLLVAAVFLVANMALLQKDSYETGRPYLVEVNRIAWDMEETGLEWVDLSGYQYVTKVEKLEFSEDADRNRFMGFYTDSDYVIREVNGCLYRFDYSVVKSANQSRIVFLVNVLLGCMALVFFVLLYY